jgi:hypothetical protein
VTGYSFRIFALASVLIPAPAAAQSLPHPMSRNGTWDIGVWIGEAIGREGGGSFAEAQVSMAAFRLGRVIAGPCGRGWIRGTLSYGFDLVPVFVTTGTQTVYGGGFDAIVLQWTMTGTRRLQPFFEAAGGGVFTTSDVPPGDTSTFNFIPKAGGGVYIYTAERRAIALGLRYWHLSNGNLGDTNPAFNGIQLTIGYHWFR